MDDSFETLISGYLDNEVGISNHFINETLATNLQSNLLSLHGKGLFHSAGTGNDSVISQDKKTRSDEIYWLDKKHDDKYENEFFSQMDDFVKYLNHSCYTGITDYEFHYSMYEKGSFYKKHLDQFKSNSSRQFSMISYLNKNWKEEDGGQLLIHPETGEQTINPTQGKTVFFKSSELEHEVIISNKQRMSITGWLKRE